LFGESHAPRVRSVNLYSLCEPGRFSLGELRDHFLLVLMYGSRVKLSPWQEFNVKQHEVINIALASKSLYFKSILDHPALHAE
jgi:hypothetical protein